MLSLLFGVSKATIHNWFYKLSFLKRFILDFFSIFLWFPILLPIPGKSFFNTFYRLYGKPKLIISDGSKSLAYGRKAVFADVPHQLCKFHKMKNLNRRIYLYIQNPKKRKRMLFLAKGIFGNATYFGRKRTARKLMEIACPKISEYVRKNILGDWKHLTKGYTFNVSERWNRKIEKVTSGRYMD